MSKCFFNTFLIYLVFTVEESIKIIQEINILFSENFYVLHITVRKSLLSNRLYIKNIIIVIFIVQLYNNLFNTV